MTKCLSDPFAVPSDMFEGIDTAARRNCPVRPYISLSGNVSVAL